MSDAAEMISDFNIADFDPKHDLCIEASAGTGKTFTINLIVKKLVADGTPLEKILIVTYTEKAAGELKSRIRRTLAEAEQNERFKAALEAVDNAPIFTIHSFCKQTLEEFAFNANTAYKLGMTGDGEMSDFFDKWIRDDLAKNEAFQNLVLGTDKFAGTLKNKMQSALFSYYEGTDVKQDGDEPKKVISLDAQDIVFADTPIPFEKAMKAFGSDDAQVFVSVFPDFDKQYAVIQKCVAGDEIEKKLQEVHDSIESNPKQTKTKEKNLQDCKKTQDDWHRLKSLLASENILSLVKKQLLPLGFRKRSLIPASLKGMCADESLVAVDEAISYFRDLHAAVFCKLGTVFFTNYLPELYKKWQRCKVGQKVQSYDDMIRTVREAVLAENATLREQLRQKYTYAIIDEFQDTNQRQWDIFSTLFLDKADGKKTHSIFVVGDPKQSIYSFQGANINVYKSALEEIVRNGGYKRKLAVNWRSSESMINACNALFAKEFFSENNCTFIGSGASKKIQPALLYNKVSRKWEETKPFHIALNAEDKEMTEELFAQLSVAKIIDWCTFVEGIPNLASPYAKNEKPTRLLIWDKDKKIESANGEARGCYRPVSFKDFAVLANTRSEMVPIERELRRSGVPFLRYKDANLFNGSEALQWIALFSAIDAPDFTGSNVRILRECLFSDFFKQNPDIPATEYFPVVADEKNTNPENNPALDKIKAWKLLADARKWAQLFEDIYAYSHIEEHFSTLEGLNYLTKLRQIGDYALDYLYSHSSDLVDVTDHLKRLVQASQEADEDDNLIAKGTDFNSVQVMTIHASKGLEFPVVISAAGFKRPRGTSVPFTYNENGLHLTFSDDSAKKDIRKNEDGEEQQRKYYVDYTRATSVMLLPQYSKWSKSEKDKKTGELKRTPVENFKFLYKSFEEFIATQKDFFDELTLPDTSPTKDDVAAILSVLDTKTKNDGSTEDAQIESFGAVNAAIKESRLQQHSYTSLSRDIKHSVSDIPGDEPDERTDSDGQIEEDMTLSRFDRAPKRICTAQDYDTSASVTDTENYPRGKHLGVALHKVFELADFQTIGALKSQTEAEESAYLFDIIKTSFAPESIAVIGKDGKPNAVARTTARIVWHTMHASLPQIRGADRCNASFSLAQLAAKDCKAEIEFAMLPESGALRNFCKGFIDLLFMPPVSEGEPQTYAILDWKSDIMPTEDFSSGVALQKKVDEDYAIQRTLYSYCLVKWLKAFYPQKEFAQIFAEHFGGIYYVFARGTQKETTNGIYAQTWNSWTDLETAFNEIRDEKITHTAQTEKEQN